ncbi:MAG: hypothetical protein AVDCRST_MAG76-2669 [uncultured Acidimicrobiales bacterium]|uniref:Uncharacterized protein n=1 Tax=uncultured Acidimicrobiales bacterium TaxID=310071 RepID=A0A6J4IQ52_9ACTN|nr:MAG: hypothetical protein AVDCRST_MAG76-2669 [uncultured Acidimicrobiales bacterium]
MSEQAGLPYHQRPDDDRPIHTDELPDTPTRDRTVVATAWVEAPPELLELGADLGHRRVGYLRRIHRWLLWRAGPASGGDARYMALAADDLTERYVLRLFADGTANGVGPSGATHTRFRSWKEDLRDTAAPTG